MPETVTAPAPAAPAAPTPAAPPTPARNDAASPVTTDDNTDRELEALDSDFAPPPEPAPKPKAQAKVEPPAAVAPEKPEAQKPEEATKPEGEKDTSKDVPEYEGEGEPVRIADLRKAYRTLKKRIREEYRPELSKLRTEREQLAQRPQTEVTPFKEQLETAQKRMAELEKEIEFTNFSKSQDFQENYEKPYNEEFVRSMARLKGFKVPLEDGTERPISDADFAWLCNLDDQKAWELAGTWFDRAANAVMNMREKVIDLAVKRERRLAQAKEDSTKRIATMQADLKAQHEKKLALWKQYNDEYSTKYPHLFAKVEGDTEGNAMLDKGYAMVDQMFNPTPENPAPKTPEEIVRLHARVRNKAANHDRLALRLKKANARINELQKALDEYEEHSPNGGIGRTEAPKPSGDWKAEYESEIDQMDRPGL